MTDKTPMKRTRAPHFADQSPGARQARAIARDRARNQTPERKAAQLARQRTLKAKAARRAYSLTPEAMAADRAYHQTPNAKASALARQRTPEYKMVHRAYMQTPEGIARTAANLHKMPIEIPNRPRPASCECCGGTSNRPLHFDHCHDTGRFRGWCCHGCNTCHGIADNPKRLRLRALYVERSFQSGPINWAYPTDQIAQLARVTLTKPQIRMSGTSVDVH